MNSKDKQNLSYLYEMDQYKSLEKLCKFETKKIANRLLNLDMTHVNSDKTVTLLQGQALALTNLLAQIHKYHKDSMKSDS